MHLQVLASGSAGNCALLRVGETHILLDAGLPVDELLQRLDRARVSITRLDHIVLTHGHLDHARAAGTLARRSGARVHCASNMMNNASLRRAPHLAVLPIDGQATLTDRRGHDPVQLRCVEVPHDAQPTVALRLEADDRVLVLLTDLGTPEPSLARRLEGAHVVMLEFNHDAERLASGNDPPALKRRIAGPLGHLSNQQAAQLLERLVSPHLHTVVLTHLSQRNNTPELALAAATGALGSRGDGVRLVVASQEEIGPNLKV